MRINPERCVGCIKCVAFCCGNAILQVDNKCVVDEDKCFECYVCVKSESCPADAFEKVSLKWPRRLRNAFSSVSTVHKETGIEGRGTAEMKTNDVTGHYRLGEIGFTVDVGRPGIGTTFEDVQKIAMAVAKLDVQFEQMNPTTKLMSDSSTGKFRDDIKTERILSCILAFKVEEAKLLSVINTLSQVSKCINTVFSVGCICKCTPDGTVPVKSVLDKAGIFYRPNGKTNIGLGRPLARM